MRTLDEFGFIVPDEIDANEERLIRAVLEGQEYPPLPDIPDFRVETIVDVGANIGAFAAFARRVHPAARIVCFEPSERNLAYLQKNAERLSGIEIIAHGLSDRDARRPFYRGHSAAGLTDSLYPNRLTTSERTDVALHDAARLFRDHGLQRISLLKLDTEGAEVPILKRLEADLELIDAVVVEFHSEEDRRAIDRILERTHVLYHARVSFPHRGTMGYLRAPLAAAAGLDARRIARL